MLEVCLCIVYASKAENFAEHFSENVYYFCDFLYIWCRLKTLLLVRALSISANKPISTIIACAPWSMLFTAFYFDIQSTKEQRTSILKQSLYCFFPLSALF